MVTSILIKCLKARCQIFGETFTFSGRLLDKVFVWCLFILCANDGTWGSGGGGVTNSGIGCRRNRKWQLI